MSSTRRNPWSWIPSLYLIEGLPNAIVVTVAVVVLKNLGIDNSHVALYTSLLYLPWVIKPFWSPFVDIFGTKRLWITAMQLVMGLGLGAIALALGTSAWLAATLTALWVLAFSSATHDIAADGFYMLALDEKNQAVFVGIRSTFYRLATLLASGGVVWSAGKMMERGAEPAAAWQTIFAILAGVFILAALYHAFILPKPASDRSKNARGVGDILRDFGQTVVTFFRKPHIGVALAFMLLYRLPEAVLCKMVQPFLLDPTVFGGMGLTVGEVGLANGTYGVIGIVAGGIIGGLVIARFGLRRCLWPMALALTLPSAFYCYLALAPSTPFWLICTGIAIEQFGYGFGFTAYMMYLMKFSEGTEYTTSHYAFSTGLMALGLMVPGLGAGALQAVAGYPLFFALVMALCPATFVVTALARRTLS